MYNFGDKLKECRRAKNMTLEELALKYNRRFDGGLSKGTLSKYENNKQEPLVSVVTNLTEILDVSSDYLLGRSDNPNPEDITIASVADENVHNIPVFNSVSAGLGRLADSTPDDFVPTFLPYGANPEEYVRINVSGDSMSPLIDDGSQILVRLQPNADNGSVAVVLVDGEEAFVKRLNYGMNWVELESINPYYPARRFENTETSRVNVLGVVKEVTKYL
ncbi:MAG: LexA family transcriptional regulator [Ruminococcaceae bacterium]|nr:LexA family transcriptional regulator [Oscillospiraceae bacterium]